MGLHQKSSSHCPIWKLQFADGRCGDTGIEAFFGWWDSIKTEDAQAAVDFIWPGQEG